MIEGMDMLKEFPLLIPVDAEGCHYQGYIKVAERMYHLEVRLPTTRRLCDATINCDWQLQRLLVRYRGIIKQRLVQCKNLLSFLKELHSIIERQLEAEDKRPDHAAKFCTSLVSHIEALGWDRIVYIDPSFQQVHIQHIDEASRKHVLKVTIGAQYPKECPKCQTEIPGKFEVHWTPQSQLRDLCHQFSQCITAYKDFWDMMSEVDKNTWVLEPDKPTYSAVHRRIAISTNASLQITVDPQQPRALPECRFLGAEQVVSPLREKMNKNLNIWNEEATLLENLETVLGISFPSPANTKKEEFSVECGICYSYRMELEIPDEVCSDTRCGQAFHRSCLYEWLRALPTSRQSFNTIFGDCPYCEKVSRTCMKAWMSSNFGKFATELRPLIDLHEVQLFGDEDILQDLFILFCEWPEDSSQVLIFGHSLPGRDVDSCQCYFTIAAVPSLAPCKPCRDTRLGPGDKSMCLKHSFCFHSKYDLTPPFPMFCPRLQLKCDGTAILNTGDSIVALSVQLDSIHSKSKVNSPGEGSSLLKNMKSKDNSSNDKNKDVVCCSPEPGKEFEWDPLTGANQLTCDANNTQDGVNYSIVTYAKTDATSDKKHDISVMKCVDEDQKENTGGCGNGLDISKCKSPKSPKNILSTNQRSPTQALPPERWFESRNLTVPTSPNQSHGITSQTNLNLRFGRAGCSTSVLPAANDLYNFDSDDSEDNTGFMCPNVPRFSLRSRPTNSSDILSHTQNLVISPSLHLQRQLGLNINRASPLINSQALNCLQNFESPRNIDNVVPRSQRSFFSPSNSEHSFGGTSSSADSVIVQINDARTVTHSWRKFSYHGDTEVDSTLVIEDDFDLTYRSVLPAEVRGTKNRQLSLSLEPADGILKITFDIEHYMEETIRGRADWGDSYIAFTNYDLQVLDVYPDRSEVLAKVFALISARDENTPRKSRKCRGQEKLYQTSFTFELNIQSGAYETFIIEDLTPISLKDRLYKDWKPGFQECTLVRRHTYIPQSLSRCVHVLSNESVFKGKSLQMIVYPEHYTAIIL